MPLTFDPDHLDLPKGHFFGGANVPADGLLPMHRPSDGKEFGARPIASADLVDQAVTTAKSALRDSGWATCPPRQRTNLLHR